MTADSWRRLGVRVGIAVAVAIVVVLAGPLLDLYFHPVLTLLLAAVIGAVVWAFTEFLGPEPGPVWDEPYWRQRSPFLQTDIRTRRLAHALGHAQPGKGFEARRVATHLADVTAQRLVTTGRAPADDPLAHAEDHLSPALLNYLRTAESERPAVLSRKALHAHLKEIDSL